MLLLRKFCEYIQKEIKQCSFKIKNTWNSIDFSELFAALSSCVSSVFANASANMNISENQMIHLQNIAALLVPYFVVSLLIYPQFTFSQFSQEVFSLLCIYAAVFFWFMDKITDNSRLRVVIGITACAVPIIFINNTASVAIVCICLLILVEFVCIKYIQGCALFSDKIPVYAVCNNDISEIESIKNAISNEYKVLNIFVLDKTSKIEELRKKLRKINYISFFPFPRRILYFSVPSSQNTPEMDVNKYSCSSTATVFALSKVSAEFSIPVLKASVKEREEESELQLSPLSLQDFDPLEISQRESDLLSDAFRGKHVWIFYDGRKTVFDLIIALSEATSLTIFCESEHLIHDIEEEIHKKPERNCKIKIVDRNLLLIADTKPEILFFNMPLEYMDSCEDNLKEAIVKNVLTTSEIADIAQKLKIKFVFMLSTTEAANTDSWIGATQRLGELVIQNINSRNKKATTKFRVIRLPHCMMDFSGSFKKIVSAIENGEVVRIDDYINGFHYYRNDIFHPLIKLIVFTLKEQYFLPGIYSVFPKAERIDDQAVQIACNLTGIRKEQEVKILYTTINGKEENDSELNLMAPEQSEKTDIDPAIVRTRFSTTDLKSYEIPSWTIEQINEMSTRDVITAVFQSLKKKNSKKDKIQHIAAQ